MLGRQLFNSLTSRSNLFRRLGKSFGTARDLYEEIGYPYTVTNIDYINRFERQDIAKRIVKAYPDATWRAPPKIYENEEEEETDFEKTWNVFQKEVKFFSYLKRTDILSGIGRFGVLLFGFDDSGSLDSELKKNSATKLLFLQPFKEGNVEIEEFGTDPNRADYGLPRKYTLTVTIDGQDDQLTVDASRVLHVAEDCLDSNVYGTPRLEAVYNRLQDLELVCAASAEAFWRQGFAGMAFEKDPEYDWDEDAADELEGHIEDYIHKSSRYLRLEGIKAKMLDATVPNPKNIADVYLQMISGATGIPKRILTGTESGELSSTKDQENWLLRVGERREEVGEYLILRPAVDMLIYAGILPDIEYLVEWDDLHVISEKARSAIAQTRTQTLTEYTRTAGADQLVGPYHFLTEIMGVSDKKAREIIEQANDFSVLTEEDEKDIDEADEEFKEKASE